MSSAKRCERARAPKAAEFARGAEGAHPPKKKDVYFQSSLCVCLFVCVCVRPLLEIGLMDFDEIWRVDWVWAREGPILKFPPGGHWSGR